MSESSVNGLSVLLHLSASEWGGIETHVFYLSLALANKGAHVTLVSQRKFDLNQTWVDQLKANRVVIIAPPRLSRRLPGCSGLLFSRALIRSRLIPRSFDRVIGFGHGGAFTWMKQFVKPGGLFLWSEYWYGVPTRGDNYADTYAVTPPLTFSPRMLDLTRRVDGIIAGCERARKNLVEVQRVNCPIRIVAPLTKLTIPPVVEKYYDPTSVLKIVMVARQGFGKGTSTLLDIWRSLEIGPAELHFYGPVSSESLKQRLRDHWLPKNVSIHGGFNREDLPTILTGADIGLMLSIEEGYGLVPLEYMAAGLPFVSTDAGAAPEFTSNNPDAILVPVSKEGVKRGIEEMAAKVRRGATSRIRLQQFYERGFLFENILEDHMTAIAGLVGYWAESTAS